MYESFLRVSLEACFPSSLGTKPFPDDCVLGQNCEPPEEVSTIWGREASFLSLPSCLLPSPPSTHTPSWVAESTSLQEGAPRDPGAQEFIKAPSLLSFALRTLYLKSHFKAFIRFRIKRLNSTYGENWGCGGSPLS